MPRLGNIVPRMVRSIRASPTPTNTSVLRHLGHYDKTLQLHDKTLQQHDKMLQTLLQHNVNMANDIAKIQRSLNLKPWWFLSG